ncbi:MAG: metalloregulator ArsR/SmtB family transcription factor [Planctomycetota bacterium]|nr:metalloregulator ArsR/SmtB family transcription factor [Planctomycetota bacterium]
MTQISKKKPRTPREAAGCCGPIDELLDPDLFKGLSDPTRLRLLGCLAKCRRACAVSELAECCSVDLSVVSRHLALLERAGVVESAKQGRTVFYSVRYAELILKLRSLADELARYSPLSARAVGGEACCAKR